jgi:hypothetical protein
MDILKKYIGKRYPKFLQHLEEVIVPRYTIKGTKELVVVCGLIATDKWIKIFEMCE